MGDGVAVTHVALGDPIERIRMSWIDRGWESASEGMAAVVSLVRAHQLMAASIDRVLRPLGLTFARYEVLMLLMFSRSGTLGISRMGTMLQVHPTSVGASTQRLACDGLVLRTTDPRDGRGRVVSLTDSGRELAEAATTMLNAEVFDHVGLERDDLFRLWECLRALRRNAGDF